MDSNIIVVIFVHANQGKLKNVIMKTIENYEVIKVEEYNVNTSIYMNQPYSDKFYEKGFSGVVRNPDMDDRFICNDFCIWNAKGDCVYRGSRWGKIKGYKLNIE